MKVGLMLVVEALGALSIGIFKALMNMIKRNVYSISGVSMGL